MTKRFRFEIQNCIQVEEMEKQKMNKENINLNIVKAIVQNKDFVKQFNTANYIDKKYG